MENNKVYSVFSKCSKSFEKSAPHLIISSYSLSDPFDSFQRRYMTEASTLAGENVLGSFKREITLKRIVLFENKNFVQIYFM